MPVFNWSSPVRQRGEVILYPIPNEVYHEIFDCLEPGDHFTHEELKNIFSNMALVCKFFCSVAYPRLFSSFDINGYAHGENIADSPGCSHFCRDLVRGREPARTSARKLALHVKTISFSFWDVVLSVSNGEFLFLGMYLKAITRMDNIDTLKLFKTTVDDAVLITLHALPRLQCLSIVDCSLPLNLQATVIENLSSLELSSLEFMPRDDYGNIGETPLAKAFNFKNMKVLRTNVRKLLSRLSVEMEALVLEELELHELHEDDFELLKVVLQKLPCLTRLYLHNIKVTRTSNLSFSLGPSAIPKTLTFVACPAFMIPTFISHKGLESLSLSEAQFDPAGESLKLTGRYERGMLLRHSEVIRHLEVPPSFYFAVPLGELFPRLEELHILHSHENYKSDFINDASDLKKMMAQFCEASSRPLMIRRLRFVFKDARESIAFTNIQVQHEIVATLLSSVFPNLEQFSVVEYVRWIRDVSTTTTSKWKPFIPAQDRGFLRKMFTKRRPLHYVDYDGCFKSVLE